MADKILLPFGSGLDRDVGVIAADREAMRDLRNVYLRRGRIELRRGLAPTDPVSADAAIIGIFPIRSQGIGAVLTWNPDDATVKLYHVTGAGDTATLVGTVWTLPGGSAVPSVIAADSYDRLFIAHDADYGTRQATRVYNVGTSAITDLTADLDRSGVAETIRFRGVVRWLNYIIGWGYGTGADEDRPEIIRASLPGEPELYDPEHYWLAGQRGDPVLSCGPAGDILDARKASEGWRITGYDRRTFAIQPGDQHFGIAAPRLAVTVKGARYFWSEDGPRVTTGGLSTDLALPLDLDGPSVADLVAAGATANGFAVYLPQQREVQFVFGERAYVYSLDAEEWSYREYGRNLFAGGILYDADEVGGIGPESEAVIGSIAFAFEPSPVLHTASKQRATIDYTVAGTVLGGEQVEVWVRPHIEESVEDNAANVWRLANTIAMNPAGGTATADVIHGQEFDVALRVKKSGLPGVGYASADPLTWPATAYTIDVQAPLPAPVLEASGLAWELDTDDDVLLFLDFPSEFLVGDADGTTLLRPEATYEVETSPDGVTWTPKVATLASPALHSYVSLIVDVADPTIDEYQVRVRQTIGLLTSAWSNVLTLDPTPAQPVEVELITMGYAWGSYLVQINQLGDFPAAGYTLLEFELRVEDMPGGAGATDSVIYPNTSGQVLLACPRPGGTVSMMGMARVKVTYPGAQVFYSPWQFADQNPVPNCGP